MSYRYSVLAALVLILGLGATSAAMANPTCRCDVLCSRIEQRCLDLGGTLDECAEAYDNCFIQCGDPWPCGPTGNSPLGLVNQNDGDNMLGLKIPFWLKSNGELATHLEAAEEAPSDVEKDGSRQSN